MQLFKHLRYRWLSDVRVFDVEDELQYELLGPKGWQRVSVESLSGITSFSNISLLITDAKCSFRCREFPVDMVAAKDLDEAIALDIPQWNPFDCEISSLSFFERIDETWRVAVWLWPKDVEQHLLTKMPESLNCTHLMPEMAWFASRTQSDSAQLLINAVENGDGSSNSSYALVSPAGIPFALSQIQHENAASRFWRALGSQVDGVDSVLFCVQQGNAWVPDRLKPLSADWSSIRFGLFGRARLKGVKDWSNPFSWKKQMLAVLSLLFVWILTDAVILVERMDRVNGQLGSVQKGAHDVLAYRDSITKHQRYLNRYAELKSLQHQHEWLLAELSERIPRDIWLNVLKSGEGWVDIMGQGADVIRLVVLLEKIKGVKQAMLLNDIRQDARSGLENFQLRLVLEQGGAS